MPEKNQAKNRQVKKGKIEYPVDAILEEWEHYLWRQRRRNAYQAKERRWKEQASSYKGNDPEIKKIISKLLNPA